MMKLCSRHHLLDAAAITKLFEHEDHHTIAFERAGLIFIFNFHPSRSYENYTVPLGNTPCPGRGIFRAELLSDNPLFGGQGRIDPEQAYPVREDAPPRLLVYLPARTALVLHMEEP